jgi:antibiotic biosynthesis monooxygenase (ABM) superfamily enzyme
MIIYEVNLSIDKEIFSEFESWLNNHVREMLQFAGFIQAFILEEEQGESFDKQKLTVQYQLDSRDDLENYFVKFASKMREDGIKRFNTQFSATRRIFEIQSVIAK